MFRERDPQTTFLESSYLLPDDKLARLKRTWAEVFRTRVVGMIDEQAFAPIYHATEGRPNKPVEIVLGTLLLKELFDYTDRETLDQLEYNLQWHHALWLSPEEAHCCQKTLHNFRVGLLKHDGARLAFEQVTAGVVEALGLSVARQRLDSTHIVSNIAMLTRLGLFCETIRTFLRDLSRQQASLFSEVPGALVARYLKEDGTNSSYDDAATSKARRRLAVCARDLYRLLGRFRGTDAAQRESYQRLQRLFDEQCVVAEGDGEGRRDDEDDDAGEDGGATVELVPASDIQSDSLQTPHDPDATYSGHKGTGYEVQICESIADEDDGCSVITGVELTDSSSSDTHALVPMLDDLQRRELKPEEVTADTSYGASENVYQAELRGVEVVAPVGGRPQANKEDKAADEPPALTAADFDVDLHGERKSTCPAGHEAEHEVEEEPGAVELLFNADMCAQCPLQSRCPARYAAAAEAFHYQFDHRKAGLERRRQAEADGTFQERYKIRAGIEATNSELKRRHGLGRVRVRGKPRVQLAVYLKTAACNIKRFTAHLLGAMRPKLAVQGA